MKKYFILFFVFIFVLSAASVFADDLSDVKQSGTLTFAAAPDYVPFVFYDDNMELTGIDVELMKEVGRRMGVKTEAMDYAFDGLIDALQIGQVDVVGGGLSITPERQQKIDFSRAFYSGDAKFVVSAAKSVKADPGINDLSGMKIGVQKGTSFEQWIHTNLVDPAYIPAKNVYTYTKAADAMKALSDGKVDVVLLDQDTYEDIYAPTGNYKVFYDGFMKENYAFGVRQGSTLTAEINKHLNDMINDGTAQQIANKFFAMDFTGLRSSENQAQQIVKATPQAAAACTNVMAFISDVSVPDNSVFASNTSFSKTWRIKNTGTCNWNSGYSLVFKSGDHMNGQTVQLPAVRAGDAVNISVNLVAPRANGDYAGYWQLRSDYGVNFGQTLWVKIKVSGNPVPAPTPTPTDGQTRVIPEISDFYASSYSGFSGECTTVYWRVEKAGGVDISVDGTLVNRTGSVSGSMNICDEIADLGNHKVEIAAHSVTDSTYSSFNYFTEEDGQKPVFPVIHSFYVTPENIQKGDCTVAYWSVSDAAVVEIYANGNKVNDYYDLQGNSTICPPSDYVGDFSADLIARSVTDDAYASAYFNVYDNSSSDHSEVPAYEEPVSRSEVPSDEYQEPIYEDPEPIYQEPEPEYPEESLDIEIQYETENN